MEPLLHGAPRATQYIGYFRVAEPPLLAKHHGHAQVLGQGQEQLFHDLIPFKLRPSPVAG